MKKIKLKITGMHCASCSMNIEKSLRKVPGVHQANANAITNTCFVESEDAVSEEIIKKAVARAGYKVIALELH